MPGLFSRILSFGSDKELKEFRAITDKVNSLGPTYAAMSDEELAGQTAILRERQANGESLDKLLPEAFATAREASDRVLGMRHFDVQVMGAIALNRGMIAEMKTGEGKTLVSTLAGYLNALTGEGVHIVTVNDYLARRDSEWMSKLYNFLGMKVGLLQNGMPLPDKGPAYAADITYGTNSEFGFDYLRDNMVTRASMRVQRGHKFAVVDEVDSILIDEARTPLIISGAGTKSADTYKEFARAVRGLVRAEEPERDPLGGPVPEPDGDYIMDEAKHTIAATDQGLRKIEQRLGTEVYADLSGQLANHLQQALKAQYMFHRDKDYVVLDGEVKIVDEFTGRIMEGRRWSEGLHQAVEAKEGVLVREENQTLATITLQNYFRLYEKLSGMTGTADTEAYEFQDIYGLETVVIPTHRKMIRRDEQDKVYRTVDEKYAAIVADVKACHAKNQPVLLGTTSIENSELLSKLLTKEGIPHNVLNAKQHEKEAQIVLEAGRPGMVTIATNMAGRGTDIVLGGGINKAVDEIERDEALTPEEKTARIAEVKGEWQKLHDEVVAAGGLRIIGSERHESRRIDNQLRGRAGRQGDPGSSCFYLSMEDQLLRIFGGDRMRSIADRLKLEPGVAIESKMLTRMIESAQRKVEGRNYDIRKQLLEFDDVQNDQRHEIYGLRNDILESTDCSEMIKNLREGYFQDLFRSFVPADTVEEQWDLDGLTDKLKKEFGIDMPFRKMLDESEQTTDEDLMNALVAHVNEIYESKEKLVGHEAFAGFARSVLLQVIDQLWRQHIAALDALRQGIYLRGYAQKQPKQEYKREAFNMFERLLDTIRETTVQVLMRIEIKLPEEAQAAAEEAMRQGEARADAAHLADSGSSRDPASAEGSALDELSKADDEARMRELFRHVGRNDPCPCGSGKKFKDCHGRLA